MEPIRINKYISSSGVCSRREAEKYILDGKVKVNGQVISDLSTKIGAKDKVQLNGKLICLEEEKVYIMLNKPRGYVTTSKEQFGRPSVLDLVNVNQRVYPVGRLDMDSQGLLILTNDGDFTNNIIHPTKHIKKEYEVLLSYDISNGDIIKLEQGVDIGDYITRPAIVKRVSNNQILITISEGKNRQIRKMCEAIGNKVKLLKRISIGNLQLGSLKEGQYKYLTTQEIEKIFN